MLTTTTVIASGVVMTGMIARVHQEVEAHRNTIEDNVSVVSAQFARVCIVDDV